MFRGPLSVTSNTICHQKQKRANQIGQGLLTWTKLSSDVLDALLTPLVQSSILQHPFIRLARVAILSLDKSSLHWSLSPNVHIAHGAWLLRSLSFQGALS